MYLYLEMDSFFSKNDAVEALDTSCGVWRKATILVVSPRTVSVTFPGFSARYNRISEHISEEMLSVPSKWPIRTPTPSSDGCLPRNARRAQAGQLGNDRASKLVVRDCVSKLFCHSPYNLLICLSLTIIC